MAETNEAKSDTNEVSVHWTKLFKPVEGLKLGKNALSIEQGNVPIVFVPGIMGTRLKNKQGEKVWDPDAAGFMLWNYGMAWVDAADKKKRVVGKEFDPEYLQVFNDDADHNKSKLAAFPGADQRGWGGVSWSSYGAILTFLQQRAWKSPIGVALKLPVYAFGYNWTASNSLAGKKLKDFLKEVTQANKCDKAILVTHSMGGLVARSATVEHGADSMVLGIVHGVQPVTGAAAAYWRMKAGFERTSLMSTPAAWVLGTNGEEVTALLGNMPGGLQLLPSPDYTTNAGEKKWLRFEDDTGKLVTALPESDAYEEIYKNKTAYWRLVDPANLNPGSNPNSAIGPNAVWGGYASRIDRAKAFHQKLGLQPKSETQAFYGSSSKKHHTTDAAVYRRTANGFVKKAGDFWGVSWRTAVAGVVSPWTAAAYLGYKAISRTDWWQSRGSFKTEITEEDRRFEIELQPPHGQGDGTVPSSSGRALAAKTNREVPDIEHEPAYQADESQKFTAECIEGFCLEMIQAKAQK